jgi:hypothetical protein
MEGRVLATALGKNPFPSRPEASSRLSPCTNQNTSVVEAKRNLAVSIHSALVASDPTLGKA